MSIDTLETLKRQCNSENGFESIHTCSRIIEGLVGNVRTNLEAEVNRRIVVVVGNCD